MKLGNFIEGLQNKPYQTRVRILWLAVFCCMFAIVSLWVVFFKYGSRFEADTGAKTSADDSLRQIKEELPSLMSAFKASVGVFFENEQDAPQTEEKILLEEKESAPKQELAPTRLPTR